MGCFDLHDPKTGLRAIVCTPKRKTKPCFVAGCGGRGDFLCDGPLSNGKTCDRPICPDRHRHNVGPDKDLCLECKLVNATGGMRA